MKDSDTRPVKGGSSFFRAQGVRYVYPDKPHHFRKDGRPVFKAVVAPKETNPPKP